MMLKAARAWQVRPGEFQQWPMRDQLSAVALLEHEAMIGPCGHPHDVSTGDMEGWYEVDDKTVCWACAAREQYLKDNEGTIQPGVMLQVIDTHDTEE